MTIAFAVILSAIALAALSLFIAYEINSLQIKRTQRALDQVHELQKAIDGGASYEQLWDMPMPKKLRRQLVKRLGNPRYRS